MAIPTVVVTGPTKSGPGSVWCSHVGIVKTQTMTDQTEDREECRECGSTALVEKQDDAGPYLVCADCGLRQDGLGHLQQRFF